MSDHIAWSVVFLAIAALFEAAVIVLSAVQGWRDGLHRPERTQVGFASAAYRAGRTARFVHELRKGAQP